MTNAFIYYLVIQGCMLSLAFTVTRKPNRTRRNPYLEGSQNCLMIRTLWKP